jgi:hypothetical protein
MGGEKLEIRNSKFEGGELRITGAGAQRIEPMNPARPARQILRTERSGMAGPFSLQKQRAISSFEFRI